MPSLSKSIAFQSLPYAIVRARPKAVHQRTGNGMWIVPCNGIHMLGMNFAIDAVFLDRTFRVKKVYPRLPAWYGVVWIEWGAHSVLELPAGSTQNLGLQQ